MTLNKRRNGLVSASLRLQEFHLQAAFDQAKATYLAASAASL